MKKKKKEKRPILKKFILSHKDKIYITILFKKNF